MPKVKMWRATVKRGSKAWVILVQWGREAPVEQVLAVAVLRAHEAFGPRAYVTEVEEVV